MSSPRKKIIIGAGVSGASAAKQLVKDGTDPKDILVLERNDYIGGKLKTYVSPSDPKLVTEYGAGVLVQNYPIIDTLYEKGIHLEKLVPAAHESLAIYNDIMSKSLLGAAKFSLDFLYEQAKFIKYVQNYKFYRNHLADLPPDYQLPFATFSKEKGLTKSASFLEWLGPGFGYGMLDEKTNTAGRIFNYMGMGTILGICSGNLHAVHGGYQQVVERMLEGIETQVGIKIQKIDRNDEGVTVDYEKDGKQYHVEGSALILANSPYYWKDLNMTLTPEEQRCVDHLTYYRYPVAICHIKGLAPKQIFLPNSMSESGFGHASFLFTRDARESPPEGRLYTVYINLPAGKNTFDLSEGSADRQTIIDDIKAIPGVTDVTIDDTTIWNDYNPSVPYEDSIALHKKELVHEKQTLHLGAFRHDSFETVAATSETAAKVTAEFDKSLDQPSNIANAHGLFNKIRQQTSTIKGDLARAIKFFKLPCEKPYQDPKANSILTSEPVEIIKEFITQAPRK